MKKPTRRSLAKQPLTVFNDFVRSESFGGVILIIVVIAALAIANSSFSTSFNDILSAPLWLEHHGHTMSVFEWINDGLMSVFFLGVGIEIRRELTSGDLAQPSSRILPVFAAIGGMLVPAAIYVIFNSKSQYLGGWAIPSATDIAFSLGILSLLGSRIPKSVKIFVTALAIIDDLGAVVIIALFYGAGVSLPYLTSASLIVISQIIVARKSKTPMLAILALGVLLWFSLLEAGIHPTIAGVTTGLALPNSAFSDRFERRLNPIIAFFIVPIFAIVNAGVTIDSGAIRTMVESSVSLGIMIGLFVGKPLGITAASLLAKRFGGTIRMRTRLLVGASMLCGIGFTMSLFITQLAFTDWRPTAEAKLAILLGSVLSGLLGYTYLRFFSSAKTTAK